MPVEVDSHVVEQRIAEQAARLPEGGAVTGWASLRLAGGAYFDGISLDGTKRPVLLAVGSDRKVRANDSSRGSRERLPCGEVVRRHGVPCTNVWRAVFDEMREVDGWREAVVALDMAAAAELVSISQMAGYAERHSSWRRSNQVSTALSFAHEESRSPMETRLRLVWEVDAGLPRPRVNRPLFDLSGKLICIPDLFDERAGLVVEFDGAEHRGAGRHSRDVRREENCRGLGLEYAKVTGLDMRSTTLVVRRLLAARARAPFTAPGGRRWTLQPPPWWSTRETLDQRFERRAALLAQLAFERGEVWNTWHAS